MSFDELDGLNLDGKTANKGEWAEIYVFLRLLGEGRLYAADDHMNKNPNSYVEVLRILREEIAGAVSEYARNDSIVELYFRGEKVLELSASEFLEQSRLFFEYLKTATPIKVDGRNRGILVSDDLARFSHVIKVSKPKSPSVRSIGQFGGKTDIVVVTRDVRNALVSTMGYSIKSQFAQPPTLYNAGTSTQFEYEIHGMDDKGMIEFNSMRQRYKKPWMPTTELYKERGWTAEYVGTPNPATSTNLFMIRDSLPELMAWIYRRALLEDYPASLSLTTLNAALIEENPMNYPNAILYEKVIKDFLFASFAGMTGGVPWDGTEQVNGGYIVVLPDGEVLCYHANDREMFRQYLYTQTRIEYVSRSKYMWGTVRKDENGRYLLRLNGSFRFSPKFVDIEMR